MLSSAVWWCFACAGVVSDQRSSLELSCGKMHSFIFLCCLHMFAKNMSESFHLIVSWPDAYSSLGLLGIFLFSWNPNNCWRQQGVFGPLQVMEQHYCLWRACTVSQCDFLSPQPTCLCYSIWLLYCRSAIVLMTLETHAVILPQVLTPCSNHHRELWGIHTAVYGCADGLSRFWSLSHSHNVFLLLSLGLCCFMQHGWVSSGWQLAAMVNLQTGAVTGDQAHCVYTRKSREHSLPF